ncbi:DUF7537 family lipoprotein [Halobaculum rubrum]|uniref:DUF7537 family lipoprotein n=1 Tax=Halobaculum rubrum TaxID=2872158 RepID=UPI001CA3FB76|nr:hypothetical protein [Halobaculum rubrum]QZX98482.1 hypothetical protein K6T25_09305 [Halobaculum rubrum]
MRRPVLTLALAFAVLLAGCGAGGGGDGGRTVNPALATTPTASPTPTPEPGYPPGVATDAVDVPTLAASHDRALRDVNSTVRFRRTVVAANGTTLSTRHSVIEQAGGRLGGDYVRNGSLPGANGPPIRAFAFWTNGSVTALRTVDDDGAVSYRGVPGEPPTIANTDDSGEEQVLAAFDGTDVRPTGTVAVAGERLFVLAAEHERLNRSGVRVENFSATAYVTEAGIVRGYELRYTATYGTGTDSVTATVVERFRVTTGDTDARPPAWVDEALDAGADGETEAETESAP